ncbi:hypothetical protein FRC19_001429 [Serendipita sp. 401]|nr:hypothetical protein FRC19_001429 [Serendipita sp. 401]
MALSVAYSDFQTPNSALTSEGGPWRVETSTELYCWTARTTFCNDYGRCVACDFTYLAAGLSYDVKYLVNISVPMSQYGNANNLDYTFSYNLNWASFNMSAGTPLSSSVTVGSSRNTDNFGASDAAWLLRDGSVTSLGDPFTHAGTTSVLKSADGTTGYIPITIDFSFTRTAGAECRWFMKGAVFKITSGSGASATTASSSSSSPSVSVSGTVTSASTALTLSSVALPGLSQSSTLTEGQTVGSISSNTASSRSIPTAAIVGGVIGGISFLAIFALILFLLYRKKIRELKRRDQNMLMHTAGAVGRSGKHSSDGDSTKVPMTANQSDSFMASPTTAGLTRSAEPLYTSTATTPFSVPLSFHSVGLSSTDRTVDSQQQAYQNGQAGGQRRQRPFSNGATSFMDVPPPAYSTVNSSVRSPNDHGHDGNEEDEEDELDDYFHPASPSQLGDDLSSQVASSARAIDDSSTREGEVVADGSEISHQVRRRQQERVSAFLEEKNRRSWNNLPPMPPNTTMPIGPNATQNSR